MLRRASSALLAAGLLALVAAGCGGGDKPPDAQTAVSDTVTTYAHAFGSGDGEKACALLTSEARDAFVKRMAAIVGTTDCVDAMDKLTSAAGPEVTGPFQDATVNGVKVDGDSATASLVAGGHTEEVTLERQDDAWLLTKAPGT
jgi:hypothetical protein